MSFSGSFTNILIILAGTALIGVIGAVDYFTSIQLALMNYYLVPIVMVTLVAGMWPGFVMSIFATLVWFTVNSLNIITYSHSSIPYLNAMTMLMFFLIIVSGIVKLRAAVKREKDLAGIDYLTGIPNSKAFYKFAEREINRSGRYNHPLSVAYIDCDNFKDINDKQGHLVGDELLKKVANGIKNSLRTSDYIARLGGDEFALLLPETDQEVAGVIIPRLKNTLSAIMAQNKWPVTFSVGLATFTDPPESVNKMLSIADRLMYSTKNNGKNNITVKS